jgi:hypothetical protein
MTSNSNTTEFYCLIQNPRYAEVANWLLARNIRPTVDLLRMRFHIPNNTELYTEFIKLYVQVCPMVPPDEYARIDPRHIRTSAPKFS